MSKRLQHALHNEKANKFLRTKSEFADWIVTTSFYSAIHFVEHFIFPFDHVENGTTHTLKNVYDYQRLRRNKSKHELRQDLVMWKIPELAVAYSWLYNTCYNARYLDYRFPNAAVTLQLADMYLKQIKAHCDKKKP